MALTQQDIALIQQMGRQQNPDSIWDVLGNLAAQWIRKENGQSPTEGSTPAATPAPAAPAESAPAHQVNIDATPGSSSPIILNKTGTWFPMNGSTGAPSREPAQFVPEYNRITPDDDLSVIRAKNRAQGYTFDTPSILDALVSYARR